MRFFDDMAGAMAGLSNRLSNFGGANDNPASLSQTTQNPMQAACNGAPRDANGFTKLSELFDYATQECEIAAFDVSDLRGVEMTGLILDAEGVDKCGGSVSIGGAKFGELKSDPYSTAACLDTQGVAAEIGRATFVGYKDMALTEVSPLSNVRIGEVCLVDEAGNNGHNIAVSFEDSSIGAIQAAGTNHINFSAKNCHIGNANFEGAKALAIDVVGGQIGGNFDAISIAPNSQGIRNARFEGRMRNANGYTSLVGSTLVGAPDMFAGTDIAKFNMAGVNTDLSGAGASVQEAVLRSDLAASAANMAGGFGQAVQTEPALGDSDGLEVALAQAYDVAKSLQGKYGGSEIMPENAQTKQYTVDHSAEYGRATV
jgi:hypothetical protein